MEEHNVPGIWAFDIFVFHDRIYYWNEWESTNQGCYLLYSTDLQGGQGDNCGDACVRGSVLYVSTDQAKPVTAFITEKGREDIAISVTMIPERIAPRQVEFLLPKSVMEKLSISDVGAVEGSSTQARRWEQSQPYIDTIKESFKAIALGQVPQGYCFCG